MAGGEIIMEHSWRKSVENYLSYKRKLGFDLRIDATRLFQFARFAEECHSAQYLTIDLCVCWAQASKKQDAVTWTRRIDVLRGFARYLKRFDSRNEVPPSGLFGSGKRRLVPHIFTEDELVVLLKSAGQLSPPGGLRPATCRTVFGLLSATGLRIGEALALTNEDVDITNDVLRISASKGHRPRIVPLHSSVSVALKEYVRLRDHIVHNSSSRYFFLLDNGKPVNKRQLLYALHSLCRQLSWLPRGDYPNHRLHDFRHTFIVRTAMRAYELGMDADKQILALSSYVGHVKVSDTYWYFTGVPELMSVAAKKFEQYAQGGAND